MSERTSFQISAGHYPFPPDSDGLVYCPCSHHKGSNKKYRSIADIMQHLRTVQKLISSSVGGEFTFLSPYLLESSTMARYGIIVNTQHKLLICLSCSVAIIPLQLRGHLSKQHKMRLLKNDESPISNLLSISQVNTSAMPELPLSIAQAIDGLPIIKGHPCPIVGCSNIRFTHESLKAHMRKDHKGAASYPANTDTCSVQVIKRGFQPKVIRVPEEKPAARFTEEDILSQVKEAMVAPPAPSLEPSDDPRSFCPWLRHIRWQDLVMGKDIAEMMALVAHPKSEEFPKLQDSFLHLLRSGTPLFNATSELILKGLITVNFEE